MSKISSHRLTASYVLYVFVKMEPVWRDTLAGPPSGYWGEIVYNTFVFVELGLMDGVSTARCARFT
jgi:hypothetical protein